MLKLKIMATKSKRKKLIAGIVLTGGGSQLKHSKAAWSNTSQEWIRELGHPSEHLAGDQSQRYYKSNVCHRSRIGDEFSKN